MSVLEIILYSLLATGLIIYATIMIVDFKKNKGKKTNGGKKEDEEED